ncbi:MAG: hypothetical protein IJF08_03725, partial [Clostridia bacterium]|nr:hypothetical protein [Clostridia bacterium]
DTNLEFWIAENVDNVDFSEYQEKYGMFGGNQYYGKDYAPIVDEYGQQTDPEYYVLYTVTSYPDYSDRAQHITCIEITDPSVYVWGITVDTSLEDFERIVQEYGFEIETTNDNSCIAKQGKYTISMGHGNIMIRVEVENKDGIIF